MRAKLVSRVLLSALAAFCLVATPALAQPKKKAEKEKPAPAAPAVPPEPPTTKTAIKLVPEGMTWGMVRGDLEKMMDRFVDEDFKPKYKAAGKSGPKIRDLDTEAAAQKAAFKRSWIDLNAGPTGLDNGPLADEFTKGNGEALMSHHRGPGVKIWFFFIGGRLWKTIEEVTLIDGGLYGKDVAEAAKKIVDGVGGTMPRAMPAEPDKGKYYDVIDWQDSVTHMRVWDRSGVIVIVREERVTLANLPSLRKNKGTGNDKIDPSVAAIARDEPKKEEPKKEEPKKQEPKKK